ncbi:terpenoid synthase [Gautieria morchelliformis]|nr:terpenoid synthase [Gautieria morchelliformis]
MPGFSRLTRDEPEDSPHDNGAMVTEMTRNAIRSFLRRCDIPLPAVDYDYDFDAACRAEAVRRGYPMEGPNSLAPFIPGGVAMVITAYAHLTDESIRLFISLYTAFLIYTDDVFQYQVDAVREFNERFVAQKPQQDPVLHSFANLLPEFSRHFSAVASNIMITSTLNLITALLLEHDTRGMAVRQAAGSYPTFCRAMSGAADAYALFAFPPELALPTYIQAFPDVRIYIDDGNDVFSFYKEELSGECGNRICLRADIQGTSKHEVLQQLVDSAVDAHHRVIQILKPHRVALDAYRSFANGYVGFHAVLPRYKWKDLELQRDLI